jgi:hypothetical protein
MGYRCGSSSPSQQCTFDYRSIGSCNYQNPSQLADYCTYIVQTGDNRCDNPDITKDSFNIDTGETRTPTSRCMPSNLLHLDQNLDVIQITAPQSFKCYKTRCASEVQLYVGVKYLGYDIWYPCPANGDSKDISVVGYNGVITCIQNFAPSICLGSPTDDDWPILKTVIPTTAKPGDTISLNGAKFTSPVKVIIRGVGKATVKSETEISAVLPDAENWDTFSDLFTRTESIIIIDANNRTAVLYNALTIQLDTTASLGRFFKYNPLWAALIFGGLGLILIGLGFCIYHCCCKKDKDDGLRRRR